MDNRMISHLQEIDWIAKLADLKNSQYENMLLLHALVELLIDKQIITRQELIQKVETLDR